jgi:hypothetical protein
MKVCLYRQHKATLFQKLWFNLQYHCEVVHLQHNSQHLKIYCLVMKNWLPIVLIVLSGLEMKTSFLNLYHNYIENPLLIKPRVAFE